MADDTKIRDDVKERLKSLGYTFDPTADDWVLDFLIGKVLNGIKNDINQPEIPEGLYEVAVDIVCGEFLLAKNVSGGLNESNMNTAAAVRSLTEGDTSVTFAVADGAVAGTLNKIIDWLMNGRVMDFARYRKLVW